MLDDIQTANEICWTTGIYTADCNCQICSHSRTCGRSNAGDDDH